MTWSLYWKIHFEVSSFVRLRIFCQRKNFPKFTKCDKVNIELQIQRYRLPIKIILTRRDPDSHRGLQSEWHAKVLRREWSEWSWIIQGAIPKSLRSRRILGIRGKKKKRRFFIYSYGVYVISSNLHTCKRNLYPLRIFQSKGNGRAFDEKSGFSRGMVDRPRNVRKHREYVYTCSRLVGWVCDARHGWRLGI